MDFSYAEIFKNFISRKKKVIEKMEKQEMKIQENCK